MCESNAISRSATTVNDASAMSKHGRGSISSFVPPLLRASELRGYNFPMPTPAQIIHARPGEGAAFSAVGDVYRHLATGAQTGGAYVLTEARVLPGGGPPPHMHHREDEAFFILEGEIVFTLGGRRIVAGAGTFVQAPRDIPHAFKNESAAPARMLITVTPPGFERFMEEFAQPVPSFDSPPLPVTPADIEKLLAVAPKYGIEILPPPQ